MVDHVRGLAESSRYVSPATLKGHRAQRIPLTPAAWANWPNPGNAQIDFGVTVIGGIAHFDLEIIFGSTSGAWTDLGIAVSAAYGRASKLAFTTNVGSFIAVDDSTGTTRHGLVRSAGFSTQYAYFHPYMIVGTTVGNTALGSAFAPAVGDVIRATWSWPLA